MRHAVLLLFVIIGFAAQVSASTLCTVAGVPDEIMCTAMPKLTYKLHTYTTRAGKKRTFMAVNDEGYFKIFYTDEGDRYAHRIKTVYDRYDDGTDFYDEGLWATMDYETDRVVGLDYTVSPDNRFLYVVGDIRANSNGWIYEYQLFRINCETLEVKIIADAAAIAVTERGFKYAEARLTNEDTATCTADENWVMHDVEIDWEGVRYFFYNGEEYNYDVMTKNYGRTLRKGFRLTK